MMGKLACQYAIVHFRPFVETGEFANVGVVLLCPEARYFGFRLLTRYGRVTKFFHQLERRVYLEALGYFKDELQRVRALLKGGPLDGRKRVTEATLAHQIFAELVRRREALMRFDEARLVLADDPEAKLQELFDFYVERNFVTKAYQERLLESGVRKLLFREKLGERFTPQKVGNADFFVRFPFVHRENDHPEKIIKPLHLAHAESKQIIDHGGAWVDKVRRLRRRGFLPREVLFAVQAPHEADERRFAAYREIHDDLLGCDVAVIPAVEEQRIVEFARS